MDTQEVMALMSMGIIGAIGTIQSGIIILTMETLIHIMVVLVVTDTMTANHLSIISLIVVKSYQTGGGIRDGCNF